MALNKGSSTGHFVLRLLGLTGLFAVFAGGVAWSVFAGQDLGRYGQFSLFGGLAAVVLALLFEIRGVAGLMSSRRGAVGASVAVQIALAILLVGGLNYFSFEHYKRLDWTWDHAFTLKPKVVEQLSQLRGDTDIVVLQQYVSFGQRGEGKQDRYDLAAQKKIIEKVRDLADLFQDLGPRFRVRVLDIQDDDYENKVREIREGEEKATKDRGEEPSSPLADAIDKAPENSIFFRADGRVQRLAFHDVYQIDKEASEQANGGRGNLVLNFQGVEPFARKILSIEEKKPQISVAVVHPVLSTSSRDEPRLTMNGAKKYLESQGFLCKDILLRKQNPEGGLSQEPAVETFDENRYEQIEEILPALKDAITHNQKILELNQEKLTEWEQPLNVLQKSWAYIFLPNGQQGIIPKETLADLERRKAPYKSVPIDEEDRASQTFKHKSIVARLEKALKEARQERDLLEKERSALNVDELAEKRRIADVEAKMKRMLADTDLLVIPRFTFLHLPTRLIIESKHHKLDGAQLQAVKAFLKEGKPVLFLLGPANERVDAPPEFGGGGGDDGLEPMLAELGVRLPKQTILYDLEAKDFSERKEGLGFSSRELKMPPVQFDWKDGVGQVVKVGKSGLSPNPIRESMSLIAKSIGKKQQQEDMQIRYARPVYIAKGPDQPGAFDESAVFLMSGAESWNESIPFPNEKGEPPSFNPTKDGDPKKGSLEETRLGPFPIAVAFNRTLPARWFDDKERPTQARIGVIGNGGVFVGPTLSPIREKLLLDVCDWLLGRDDLLAKRNESWSFPRVQLSETEQKLWHWGMFLGLPLVFAYVGMLVWLVRRLR